ncbi:MAG: transposase [Planctomycetota bacterium]
MAQAMADWAEENKVELVPIEPGKPTQNAYVERYNRTFRQEVLDVYAFSDLDEVRDVSTRWLWDHNHGRPHLSLDRQPPMAYRRRHEERTEEHGSRPTMNPRNFYSYEAGLVKRIC